MVASHPRAMLTDSDGGLTGSLTPDEFFSKLSVSVHLSLFHSTDADGLSQFSSLPQCRRRRSRSVFFHSTAPTVSHKVLLFHSADGLSLRFSLFWLPLLELSLLGSDCRTLFGWRHSSTSNICIKRVERIVNGYLCYICCRIRQWIHHLYYKWESLKQYLFQLPMQKLQAARIHLIDVRIIGSVFF
ncbi:hypothetical protein F0562_034430 [Nyssa sinensis]|uniref:Uncharacterized protein n=1 Tax=Nyssa sinensis TaxID=561372 RepID=A0A5J5AJX0_9ASTE|nr:hypothetical protein F0562_034430 [Nyssa sinensis]